VSTIVHTEFSIYKNLVLLLNSSWWTSWTIYTFYQKRIYVSSYQEGIHYCTPHKCSTRGSD